MKVLVDLNDKELKQIDEVLESLFQSEFWNERILPLSLEEALLKIKGACGGRTKTKETMPY